MTKLEHYIGERIVKAEYDSVNWMYTLTLSNGQRMKYTADAVHRIVEPA